MKELLVRDDVNILLLGVEIELVEGVVVLMENEDVFGLISRKYFSNKFGGCA